MKRQFLFLVMLLLALPVVSFAQSNNNDDEVVKIDRFNMHASRPNQLLVKFHDYSDIRVDASKGGKRFVSPSKAVLPINQVLEGYAVENIEQLIPNFVMPKQPRSSKSYGGQDVVEHDLSQLHLIVLSDTSTRSYLALVEALKALDEVEYAEPNYICYALGTPTAEAAVADATYHDRQQLPASAKTAPEATFSTNDPLYTMQWGFTATRLDSLLMQPKLDTSAAKKIIAIIDTGVDIDHADLADNIWTNTAEQNGATNQDDDNNGFRDDVHGWDFVNQTGNMHDFNSHGTHCAGIAAAVGHNGIGIIGANPDALIMPVAVMQSDGSGSISTVVQGINYAAQNGADVISMSIGTYAYSIALEQALAQAYQNSLLVAAAGNDGLHIDPRCCPDPSHKPFDMPMYPGAFTFVIGVQATTAGNSLASFSNSDCDGPSASQYGEEQLYNYEISAPGVNIMSTVPNGQYRSYNGTSMACPLVAGGLSALLERRSYVNKEVLFGDMINNNEAFSHINLMNMYNADSNAPAILQYVALEMNDTLHGDASMSPDAGEELQLYPILRSVWGQADSIVYWLAFDEFEDTNTITFVDNYIDFGRPLSSYGKNKALNPLTIRIDSNVVDGRYIKLILKAYNRHSLDTMAYEFKLRVNNAVKLGGMITQNDTLWPNVHYVVTRNLAVAEGVTLVIMPGTTLKFEAGTSLGCSGKLLAIGTPDSMITFTKTDLGQGWNGLSLNNHDTLSYCIVENITTSTSSDYPIYGRGYSQLIDNSIIRYNNAWNLVYYGGGSFNNCNIINNQQVTTLFDLRSFLNENGLDTIQNNNLCNNIFTSYHRGWHVAQSQLSRQSCHLNIFNNTMYNGEPFDLYTDAEIAWNNTINGELYLGSAKESIIRQHVYDFEYPGASTFGRIDLSNITPQPVAEAHGVVWKVEVNGYDAQDEYDSITPLGSGTHEFKVYFNRAMDTTVTPMMAMGVRPPYTQKGIAENSYWNAEGTIWTAHLTLSGREAIDGINRIYVANAQDKEHFEIPYENLRFNVQVSSSGSMSAGFQATPGIGKVDLEWNDQEVNYEDFLGFNLYRYRYDSVPTNRHYVSGIGYVYDTVWEPVDTMLLNTTLLQDTMFTDYNVVPGERYYYYYKILNTSLSENSPSKTVSCVPLSAIRGDANGSLAVDIADVITAINYMTNQNPQPFLFDATDVNGDGEIDVLDVVGIINIILYGDLGKSDYEQQSAVYTVEEGVLYVDSPVALAGLQFSLADCSIDDVEVLEALNGFELLNAPMGDGSLMLMAYSMSGKQVPAGKTPLLRIGNKEIANMVLSDPEGHNVVALKGNQAGITDIEALPAQIMKVFPNPFEKEVCITFSNGMAHAHKAQLVFTNLMGQQVAVQTIDTPKPGRYAYTWDATKMPKGVYFVTLMMDGAKAHTTKVILK